MTREACTRHAAAPRRVSAAYECMYRRALPYGILLACEVGQNAISPLHLLHALWPRNGLSRAQLPARVRGEIVCEELCAPAGIHPHHRIDVCRWQPETGLKPISPKLTPAISKTGATLDKRTQDWAVMLQDSRCAVRIPQETAHLAWGLMARMAGSFQLVMVHCRMPPRTEVLSLRGWSRPAQELSL